MPTCSCCDAYPESLLEVFFFRLCLLTSLPTQPLIGANSSILPCSCAKAKRASRSDGSGWKNMGLRKCEISNFLNKAFHFAIHWSLELSSTSILGPGFFLEVLEPVLVRPVLLSLIDDLLAFLAIHEYRDCSSSVNKAEGCFSRSRAAVASPDGPAPIMITS